jgi:spore coat polysaccharide biosynthesis protein SpsF (cytidylyltransferase family)
MIVFMLRRVVHATQLDHIILATSAEKSDDVLAKQVAHFGFDCFRGDLADVLSRYVAAAEQSGADIVIRLTGDCPLIDPDLIDETVSTLIRENVDYASNVNPPTFPKGLDVEALTRETLLKAHAEAQLSTDREHVTPYVRRNKTIFRHANLRSHFDLSGLRWTVDYADDLAFIRALVDSVDHPDVLLADRFDFLRALDSHYSKMPRNVHECEDERQSEALIIPAKQSEARKS